MTLTRFRISGETALSSETRLLKSGLFGFRRRFSVVRSGVIGGWMIARVDWTVTASQRRIGQLGRVAHCVAGSCEERASESKRRGSMPAMTTDPAHDLLTHIRCRVLPGEGASIPVVA